MTAIAKSVLMRWNTLGSLSERRFGPLSPLGDCEEIPKYELRIDKMQGDRWQVIGVNHI